MFFDLRSFDFVLYDGEGGASTTALAIGLARAGHRVLVLGCGITSGSRRVGDGVVVTGHVLDERSGFVDTLIIFSPSVSPSVLSRRTIVLADRGAFVARLWPMATRLQPGTTAAEILGVTDGGTSVGLAPIGPRTH